MPENNYNEEKLKSLLQNMPKIQDHQSMEELYSKITKQSDELPIVKKRKNFFFPAIVAAAAILFIGVIFSFEYLNQSRNETAEMNITSSSDEATEGALYEAEIPELPESSEEQNSMQSIPQKDEIRKDMSPVLSFDLIKSENIFLGLNLGMGYDEMVEVIGAPLEVDTGKNISRLKYSLDGYGLEVLFGEENDQIIEFSFYPEYLPEPTFQALPKTEEQVLNIFGDEYVSSVGNCSSKPTCVTYTYEIDTERYITVQLTENKDSVINIRYGEK